MTLSDLINELMKLVQEHPEALNYEVFAVDSRSGVSDEINYFHLMTYDGNYPDGAVSDLPIGTKYVRLSVG